LIKVTTIGLFVGGGFFLDLGEGGFEFVCAGEYFIYEFEELCLLYFAIEEVKMVLILHVIEYIDSTNIGLSEDGVQAHLVVVQFASVDYQILHDYLKVDILKVGG
jgi:hypothetical protein